ncbi:MAG: polysaccharide biosynthesis protein [Gammaproteobacteria bacterium]|nr:MAG: polysaccharide biosynthesis protein [Gammaproteobacteria bacterium]
MRLDIRQEEVRRFILERLVRPAIQAGYQGVFLDTVDAWHALPKAQHAEYRAAMIELIRAIDTEVAGGAVWLNRGFDLIPAVRDVIDGVAFESLYQGFAAADETYFAVPDEDARWLLGQVETVQKLGLPVVAIDYLPPDRVNEAPALAGRIVSHGIQPWIADGHLTRVGQSSVTPVPRKVLGLYESPHDDIDKSGLHLYTATPLEYLGYYYDYVPLHSGVPQEDLAGRYAGVVVWPEGGTIFPELCAGLARARAAGLPVVFMAGIPGNDTCESLAGIRTDQAPRGRIEVDELRHGAGQFEGRVRTRRLNLTPAQLTQPGQADLWLSLRDGAGQIYAQVATTPAGGFALRPYLFEETPDENKYWLFDPVQFLKAALQLRTLPAVDVTTENGRWILLAHIDGDGFVSRAEVKGTQLAAKVTLDKVLRRFPIPHTVSIIEGEIAPHGLFPDLSAEAEPIAREIFRESYVELASHAFSHPFVWRHMEGRTDVEEDAYGWNMPIPGYTATVEREISGSIEYINERLAPPGKKVEVFLWSGDALPGDRALAEVEKLGILNTNGGDTKVLPETNSLTHVWPIGRPRPTGLQVYAPVMNENVYTNEWHGPYYGFRDVIKTFQLLDSPRRLKPMDIYYHFYSGSKYASLNALIDIYTWALDRPVTPMYISEYARRAHGFYDARLVQDSAGHLRLRSAWPVRTLRWPQAQGWLEGPGVLGWWDKEGERYFHLAPGGGVMKPVRQAPAGPSLVSANVVWDQVEQVREGGRWQLEFSFHAGQPAELEVRNARECRLAHSGTTRHWKARQRTVKVSLGVQKGEGLTLVCQ